MARPSLTRQISKTAFIGCLFLLGGWESSAFAQTQGETSRLEAGLVVNSSPTGAEVTLDGEARLTGVTPVFFSHGLPGRYELTVSKFGFEPYSASVIIPDSRVASLDVRLTPKTRLKTALRSLFVPGWGQWYSGRKSTGLGFLALTVIGGVAATVTEIDYNDKRDAYDRLKTEYDLALRDGTIDEVTAIRPALSEAHGGAYDAETRRRIAFAALGSVWAVSFLDAVLFFPSSDASVSTGAAGAGSEVGGVSIRPTADPFSGDFGLQLSVKL